MSPWIVYLVLKLDSLCGFFKVLAFVSGGLTVAAGVGLFIFMMDGEELPKAKKVVKWTLPICIFFSFLHTITPTTKEAAAIYLIPKVVNNESVQNISSNTLKLLEEYTTELLKDMKEEATKKVKDTDDKR